MLGAGGSLYLFAKKSIIDHNRQKYPTIFRSALTALMDDGFSDANKQIIVKGIETVVLFSSQLKMHQVFPVLCLGLNC